MGIDRDNSTIVSLDIRDMYPQCRFKAVKAAVRYFANQLPTLEQLKVKRCLEILKFSMGNTIVSFQDKYYEYGVDPDPNRRGLTIGGFESAFLADLETTYIFQKLRHLYESYTSFIGTYRDDEIFVFRGQRSTEWLKNWLSTFQREVDRLLGTKDIQFTMEVWRPGSDFTGPIPESLVNVESIGTFHTVSINGDTCFPYLDIKLSWSEENTLSFSVYCKPGELVKYLNTDSHHHRNHKSAVLSGVELRLALLTTRTTANELCSLSTLYPDKHEALRIAGHLKAGEQMRKLGTVLDDESKSGPARLEKKSRAVDKRDSYFIAKYASLGNHRTIQQCISYWKKSFQLKWLRPRVVYSRHKNLQERLLGDLRRKIMLGIDDADFGPRPCNCPRKFKVDGECAYGGNKFSCRTAGCVYKISCKAPDCNCFYIGKSQRYVKTRVQEHIGEVTKLYNNIVMKTNRSTSRSTPPSAPSSGSSTRSLTRSQSLLSLGTQSLSETNYEDPHLYQLSQGLCVPINAAQPESPIGLSILSPPADVSILGSPEEILPTIVPYRRSNSSTETQQANCSALARHLFTHVKNIRFKTKAEVAEWCRTNISVEIVWKSSTMNLIKTAGQKACRLCAHERLIIGQNVTGIERNKILNLKSEMRGVCSCKTRFLRFKRSDKEGGL
jgi:hypothetical protein